MNTYYVYDASGDGVMDDCADLGVVEAYTLIEAIQVARSIWTTVQHLRIVEF